MFRRPQQLRRWALRVVLVWLFGIGLGVANACLAAQQFAGGDEAFQAVADVQERLQARVLEGDIELHADEFDYWRKYDQARKRR